MDTPTAALKEETRPMTTETEVVRRVSTWYTAVYALRPMLDLVRQLGLQAELLSRGGVMANITPAKLLRTAVSEVGHAYGYSYQQFSDLVLAGVLLDCFREAIPSICVSALEMIRKDIADVDDTDWKWAAQFHLDTGPRKAP